MRAVLVQPRMAGLEAWCPPLGLLSIATIARKRGFDCSVVDLNDGVSSPDEVKRKVRAGDVDCLGITATIANWRQAIELSRGVACPVVFGGPHPTVDPAAFLYADNCFVVRGEGEDAFPSILDALKTGRSLLRVNGVSGRRHADLAIAAPAKVIEDLDHLPIPDRELVSLHRYRLELCGHAATALLTTRGCPFRCQFCYNGFLGTRYRSRAATLVVDEMEMLKRRFGYEAFVFYDDNFVHDLKRLRSICDELRRRRLDVTWRCYARVGVLDAISMAEMRDAGCVAIVFGAESGSPHTLTRIRKGITVEQTLAAGALCRSVGISGKFLLMIGFPWETESDIRETLSLIEALAPSTTSLTLFTPFPGTALYRELAERGRFIDLSADLTHLATPTFEPDVVSAARLAELYSEGCDRIRRAAAADAIALGPVGRFPCA